MLNKRDSVLIVTIDEKEYLHLGCLLEEMFPEAQIQMISISINPSGAIRKNMFSRADEYAFVLFFGDAHVNQMKSSLKNASLIKTEKTRENEVFGSTGTE